jgi:hypothetical protein
LLYNIAFSVLATAIFIFDGVPVNAISLVFAKITGFVCAVGLHYYSSKNSYFYFRNAGYSVLRILLNAFTIDIIIYLLLVTLLPLILHYAYIKG